MGSRAGLSFVQRHLEGRKEPKDYKRIDAACRGRHGDPSCSAPLLTGRASSPEQLDADDANNWGGWDTSSSKEKARRGSQKSLGASSSKNSDWDNSWGDGWNSGSNSDTSPTKVPSSPSAEVTGSNVKGIRQSASGKSSSNIHGKKKGAKEGLLIDFEEEKVGGGHDWNSKWDDEAWEMLNKKD